MKLRIYVTGLSPNDADYLLRVYSRHGAEGKIAFSVGETVAIIVKQTGTLEELMSSASLAFHEDRFRVEFSS